MVRLKRAGYTVFFLIEYNGDEQNRTVHHQVKTLFIK